MEVNLAIADRARAGEPLTAAEIDELAGTMVLSLGMLADEVRRARFGDTATFTRVFIAADLSVDPPAGVEVRIASLADSLDATCAVIRALRAKAADARLTGFSLADLVDRAAGGWGALADVLAALKAAGLDAVVEAPIDRLADADAALQACEAAGLPVRSLSIERPVPGSRTDVLLKARALTGRFPWIHAVAPLPRHQSIATPTTGYDDVRAVAMARLALPGVRNIQVDWTQYGPKLAQVALTFGANDLDRVSAVDDPALGSRRAAAEEVSRHISVAGLSPVEQSARG